MKINGADGGVIDTDSMPDGDAEITEAIHSFYELCKRYNAPFLLKVVTPSKAVTGARLYGTKDNFVSVMLAINEEVEKASGGKFSIQKKQ